MVELVQSRTEVGHIPPYFERIGAAMTRPTQRVLALLELLQSRGLQSGAELAERLQVDRRTIRRYITALEALGIPITTSQGRDGGYRLVAGYKLPPLMFTDDEALALSLGLLAARGLGLADAAPAVASAQAKLERVMPANLKQRLRAIDETVALELTRPTIALDNRVLVTLSAAAQNRQQVHLRYQTSQAQVSERDFDTYGLAYRSGRWYAIGWCHLRRDRRSFRLDRIQAVHVQPRHFVRPDDFDALAFLTESVALLPREHAIEVLLNTDLGTAQRALFPALGVLEWVDDGVLLRSRADDLDWFARELARLPFGFEIRQPAALCDALSALAHRLSRLARVAPT